MKIAKICKYIVSLLVNYYGYSIFLCKNFLLIHLKARIVSAELKVQRPNVVTVIYDIKVYADYHQYVFGCENTSYLVIMKIY